MRSSSQKHSQSNRRQERNHEITVLTLSRIPMTSESDSIKSGLVQGEAVAQNVENVNERQQGRELEVGRAILQRMSGKRSICGLEEEQSLGADGMSGMGLSKTQTQVLFTLRCDIFQLVFQEDLPGDVLNNLSPGIS